MKGFVNTSFKDCRRQDIGDYHFSFSAILFYIDYFLEGAISGAAEGDAAAGASAPPRQRRAAGQQHERKGHGQATSTIECSRTYRSA